MNAPRIEKSAAHLATFARVLIVSGVLAGLQAVLQPPLQAAETKLAITDNGITAAVASDLRFDHGLSPDSIEVNTSQGIVTLSGSTDNLLSKERAIKIAETIRGVRGVIDQIAVTPVSRPDEDIRKDILSALLQDPATESYPVAVSVKDAVATLTGTVGSWEESQLAARVAKGVKGLRAVHNDLTINYTAKRTDSEMAADIQARLQWDAWVAGDPINVHVDAGKVALTGEVGSVFERWRADDDSWVNGVLSVDSSGLRVDPELSGKISRKAGFAVRSDEQIQQAVFASFRYDPRLAAPFPTVLVEDGEVILSGKVTHLKAKNAAAQDARNTVGVLSVDNLLTVVPFSNLPGDADTQKALRAALAWDPLLADDQIEAAVIRHVAYLSGGVDDNFQRFEAADVASRVKGVVFVRNHLKVEPEFSIYDYDYDWPFYDYFNWPYDDRYALTFGLAPLKSDEQIKRAIERAFFWSPFVDRDDIKVTVDGGVAVLMGTVGTWIGYREADRDARKSGASTVIDKLTVK